MTKSATDVMQEIIVSAVLDGIDSLKAASKGMPNTLLRDINAIHANAAFADLPKELQSAINGSVRGAFNRLLKEGYSVAPGRPEPQRAPSGERRDPSKRSRGPGGGRPGGTARPSGPGRPGGGGDPARRGGRPPRGGGKPGAGGSPRGPAKPR